MKGAGLLSFRGSGKIIFVISLFFTSQHLAAIVFRFILIFQNISLTIHSARTNIFKSYKYLFYFVILQSSSTTKMAGELSI